MMPSCILIVRNDGRTDSIAAKAKPRSLGVHSCPTGPRATRTICAKDENIWGNALEG